MRALLTRSTLLNTTMNPFLKFLNLTFWGYLTLTPYSLSQAGNIYIYQEKNGTTLLTNRQSSDQSLKRIKVTYYPDSNIHTYNNWGRNEAAVPASYSQQKNSYDHIIQQAAQKHGVNSGLIKAVMHTESGFNVRARSPVGAQGLMQLMPATAKRFNVSNVYDPEQNIYAGAQYLSWLLKRFNGNTQLALAGYNAGEGNVAKYGGIPPFKETQDYVRRVTSRFNNLYANGVGFGTSTTSSQNNLALETSVTHSNPTNAQINTPNAYSERPIVVDRNGTYTDTPARSYATAHATASAQLQLD